LAKLGEIAKELGVSQAAFALAWVIKNRDVSTAITSASRPEQLDDSLQAVEAYKRITPEHEKRIDEILGNKPVAPFVFVPVPTRRDKYV
jgi:aryl-alcohol dehydrogenase-like predicted oxidoreductase